MAVLASPRPLPRFFLLAGGLLLLYSYLCRWLNLYLFWESGSVGWYLLLLGAVIALLHRIDNQGGDGKPAWLEKVGVGLLIFYLIIQTIIRASFARSDAHAAAKRVLNNDALFAQQIGALQETSIKPVGQMQTHTSAAGETGDAELYLIAKGSQQFKDVRVLLTKRVTDSAWVLRNVDIL